MNTMMKKMTAFSLLTVLSFGFISISMPKKSEAGFIIAAVAENKDTYRVGVILAVLGVITGNAGIFIMDEKSTLNEFETLLNDKFPFLKDQSGVRSDLAFAMATEAKKAVAQNQSNAKSLEVIVPSQITASILERSTLSDAQISEVVNSLN